MPYLLTFLMLFAAASLHAQALLPTADSTYIACWDSVAMHSSIDPAQWVMCGRRDSLPSVIKPSLQPQLGPVTQPIPMSEVYQTGLATYYSSRTHGRMMADGTRYDKTKLFCAHRTLPFGTMLRVVNKKNGREVVVRVRDRGPFAKGRIVDLSNKAASQLGMVSDGVVPVDLYIVPSE